MTGLHKSLCRKALRSFEDQFKKSELLNLAAKHPDKVKELLAAMQSMVDRGRSRP